MSISENEWLNLVGVGLGPFNLSLASLLNEAGFENFCFFEAKKDFNWHPGMMINDATLQVPFLADLVSLIDPKSKYSFLNYLNEHDRLFHFYFLDRNNIPRKEYNHYCQWVSNDLYKKNIIHFCSFVKNIEKFQDGFKVLVINNFEEKTYYTKNVVVGVGTSPHIPDCLNKLQAKFPDRIFHSSNFINHNIDLEKQDVVVLGSGQSSAEITLQLLKKSEAYDEIKKVYWITRSKSFLPMENSKLGLEFFTPQYVKYFYNLDEEVKNKLIPLQDYLYKGIGVKTISDIFSTIYNQSIGSGTNLLDIRCSSELVDVTLKNNKFILVFYEINEKINFQIETDIIVSGTGYRNTNISFFNNINSDLVKDSFDRYIINESYEIKYNGAGRIFIQNGEMHSHGVGSPDLGLGAWRSAIIANKLLGYSHFKLPKKTAFQKFGCSDNLSVKSI